MTLRNDLAPRPMRVGLDEIEECFRVLRAAQQRLGLDDANFADLLVRESKRMGRNRRRRRR